MSPSVRQAVLLFLVANAAFQLLRMQLVLEAELSPSRLSSQLSATSANVTDRPLGRFPFAVQEMLPSNVTIYRPINETAGFSIPELLKFCHEGFAMTITKRWAIEAPEGHHEALAYKMHNFVNTCFPLEMATNQGCRSMGFCSDYIQYVYHAGGRLVDEFDESVFQAKRITCPNSSYLHGEYMNQPLYANISRANLTDAERVAHFVGMKLEELPQSLPQVRNLWLPNVEQVLCKTRITCTAIESFVKQNKSNIKAQFQFMSHSSPDAREDSQTLFGYQHFDALINTTRSFNKFLHAFGRTGTKGTTRVLECWLRHPVWPQLTLVGDTAILSANLKRRATRSRNVRLLSFLDIPTLRALQIEHGVALCSSSQEGYGHYLNDARSMGSLLMTTDHAPMNEFVHGDGMDGILIGHDGSPTSQDHQALGVVFKPYAEIRTDDVCDAVEHVLRLSERERERIGMEGRRSYDWETALMANNMLELLNEAWAHLGRERSSLLSSEYVGGV
ncbi:hypothetical protein BC830DRAFT_1183744 [Chytriomyces sp. MP71]|nr:hypothetical protein BC830DRAFT_1183744 [Chytriomyces sp. MP71]